MKRMMVCSALILVMVSMAADVVNYTRLRKRVIGREVIGGGSRVVYKYQQGSKTWSETNEIRRVNAPHVVRYSKLKLVVAAKAAGRWDAVKAFIQQADMMDEWNACQHLTSDYPAYIAATNMVIQTGVATEAEVQAFMRQAED